MKLLLTNLFLKFFGRKPDYKIIQGYQKLKKADNIKRIAIINSALTKEPLGAERRAYSETLFGEGVDQAELICRQYLISRIAGVNLNQALMFSLGNNDSAVVSHLPPEWRKILCLNGFRVGTFGTALRWNGFIAIMLAYGLITIAKILAEGIYATWIKSTKPIGRYAYFDSLTLRNLPQPCKDGRSHDTISWYSRWPNKGRDLDAMCHGVLQAQHRKVNGLQVFGIRKIHPPIMGFATNLRFVAWGCKAIMIAILDLLHGRWWHALMLKEAAIAAQVRMQNPEFLAKDYLFHNSGWIYRPLWSYEAEAKNSRILFYFYSTNCEPIKTGDEYPRIPYGWEAMNWPHYLVWDEFQAGFIKRAVGKSAKTEIVGSIWFHTTNEKEMPTLDDRPAVAVFDITPVRDSYYSVLGLELEYYVPGICNQFLKDIRRAAEYSGCAMLWKRKRKEKVSSMTHPAYLAFTDHLSAENNVVTVDPDISAYRVIEDSILVISMPYTSTALIARELGKPSYFYDPAGIVDKNDRAAHGIEVISGYKELTELFENI